MKAKEILQFINGEPDIQKRLKSLVDHGFKSEASKLVWDMTRTCTALLHYGWQDEELCRPLPRVTSEVSAVYVIITSSSKLDYYPNDQDENDRHIVFELGWERKALGWTEDESRRLLHMILAQALVRPLNQWSFNQAEGTARATRQLLSPIAPLARKIAALHLVFHLRGADFGHIYDYLVGIQGFPTVKGGVGPLDVGGMVNWIIQKLQELGWTDDHIHKELVEWIWLKTSTWPQWLLHVAKAKVFSGDDQTRAYAVRRWVTQGFDNLLNSVPGRRAKEGMAEIYRQLFRIGQFGAPDEEWVTDKLVRQMASGKAKSVKWFLAEFAQVLGFGQLDQVRAKAIETAKASGNYGIAVAIIQDGGQTPDPALIEIVNIRSLETKLE